MVLSANLAHLIVIPAQLRIHAINVLMVFKFKRFPLEEKLPAIVHKFVEMGNDLNLIAMMEIKET